MLEISDTLDTIIDLLIYSTRDEQKLLAIVGLLKTPEQEERMLDYMLSLKKAASPEALLTKAVEITRYD